MASDKEGTRSFAVTLQQIGDGSLHAELSETLQKLCGDLSAHAIQFGADAKGTLTLTLALKASANGVVGVAGDVKTKAPKAPRVGSVFWLTKGNNLTPDNPRQQKLGLREVVGPAAPTHDLDDNRPVRNA